MTKQIRSKFKNLLLKKFLLILVLGFSFNFFGFSINLLNANTKKINAYDELNIFVTVLYNIDTRFVENPDYQKLIQGAIKGMIATLDPHSSFMSSDEMKEFQRESQGSFYGIGIELSLRDELLVVVSPIEGSPAYKAGVKAGDLILAIDSDSTKSMTLFDAVKKIRGSKGTKVTLSVKRENSKTVRTYTLIRDLIPIISVRSEILAPGYGYIKINNFQGDTTTALKKVINDIQGDQNNVTKGLILDLRNNPGGLLEQSIRVSSLFLGKTIIVETKGKVLEQNASYSGDENILIGSYPIVVLVNEGTASASEIVAGALQDHGRALILGAKTFGKGSVQSLIMLPDGSGLKLTTARYYTPLGRSIQAEGITPDVAVASRFVASGRIIREKDLSQHLSGDRKEQKNEKEDEEYISEEDVEEPLKKSLSEMTVEERLAVDKQLKVALDMLKTGKVPIYNSKIKALS